MGLGATVETDDPLGADDAQLVAQARTDSAAFGTLYHRYVGRIYAFAHRRTWTREAAEDVTAATFERAKLLLDDPFRQPVGPGELDIPAVRGVGGRPGRTSSRSSRSPGWRG